MAVAKKYVYGTVILFVLASVITVMMLSGAVRIDVNKEDTRIYVNESGSFVLGGIEKVTLFGYTPYQITLSKSVKSTNVTIIRTSKYNISGKIVTMTNKYYFDGKLTTKETFPIKETHTVTNGKGNKLCYDVTILSPKVKVTLNDEATIQKSSIYCYEVTKSTETFNIRLFDPNILSCSGTIRTYIENSINYTVCTFLTNGTFNTTTSLNSTILIVAGGGGAGHAGGGGGGGLIYNSSYIIPANTYNIIIGLGGVQYSADFRAQQGGNSSFNGLIAVGGGGGGSNHPDEYNGGDGGSGGGGGSTGDVYSQGGFGTAYQGTNGSNGVSTSDGYGAGGGGGAGQSSTYPNGGNGLNFSINNSNVYYAGGGGGGSIFGSVGTGGLGGGGSGTSGGNGNFGINGTGGGGGGGYGGDGRAQGGSGIVIIRVLTNDLESNPIIINSINITPIFPTEINTTLTVTMNVTGGINATLNCTDETGIVLNQFISGILYNISTITNPNYYNNITCNITAFNGTTSTIGTSNTVYINATIPSIVFVSPTQNSNVNITSTTIAINITTNNMRTINNITIYLYNSTLGIIQQNSSATNNFYRLYSNLPRGLYFYNATVWSNSGKTNSTELRNISIYNNIVINSVNITAQYTGYANTTDWAVVNVNNFTALYSVSGSNNISINISKNNVQVSNTSFWIANVSIGDNISVYLIAYNSTYTATTSRNLTILQYRIINTTLNGLSNNSYELGTPISIVSTYNPGQIICIDINYTGYGINVSCQNTTLNYQLNMTSFFSNTFNNSKTEESFYESSIPYINNGTLLYYHPNNISTTVIDEMRLHNGTLTNNISIINDSKGNFFTVYATLPPFYPIGYVDIKNASELNFYNDQNWTISIWVNRSNNGTYSNFNPIFSFEDANKVIPAPILFNIYNQPDGPRIHFGNVTGWITYLDIYPGGSDDLNEWKFYVIIRKDNNIITYVNGVNYVNGTLNNSISNFSTISLGLWQNFYNYIGAFSNFLISNYSMNSSEVLTLNSSGRIKLNLSGQFFAKNDTNTNYIKLNKQDTILNMSFNITGLSGDEGVTFPSDVNVLIGNTSIYQVSSLSNGNINILTFNDSSSSKSYNFTVEGTNVIGYLKIPKVSTVIIAKFNITGNYTIKHIIIFPIQYYSGTPYSNDFGCNDGLWDNGCVPWEANFSGFMYYNLSGLGINYMNLTTKNQNRDSSYVPTEYSLNKLLPYSCIRSMTSFRFNHIRTNTPGSYPLSSNFSCYDGSNWIEINYTYYPSSYFYVFWDVNMTVNSNPYNPFVKTGIINGSKDWNVSGLFNYTATVNSVTNTSIQTYLASCTADSQGFCYVPINVYSVSPGIITVSNINVTYSLSGVKEIIVNDTFLQNYVNNNNGLIDLTITQIGTGIVNVSNLKLNYYGGNKNITIISHTPDYNLNSSHIARIYYSGWNYSLPKYIDWIEFIPGTPTSKNVTPYGQQPTKPIFNITNTAYTKNFNLSIYQNETDSCVNITVSTSYNKSAGYLLSNVWTELYNSSSYLTSKGLWFWADFYCNQSSWQLWNPDWSFRACCDGCVCDTSIT
jgi:hypothetical protein